MKGYSKVTLLGRECFFTVLRIGHKEVPKGMYRYDLRHDDCNPFDPTSIEKNVWNNHLGTILTEQPFDLGESGVIDLEPDDYRFDDEIRMEVIQ